jgi:hypothetical protein
LAGSEAHGSPAMSALQPVDHSFHYSSGHYEGQTADASPVYPTFASHTLPPTPSAHFDDRVASQASQLDLSKSIGEFKARRN